jgi:hypothetical protein
LATATPAIYPSSTQASVPVSTVHHLRLTARDRSSDDGGYSGRRADATAADSSESEESDEAQYGQEGAPHTPWSLEQTDAAVNASESNINLDHHAHVSDLGGLLNSGGLGTHLMPHTDMLYLASLWDPSFNNPVLEQPSNSPIEGLSGNNHESQENRFHLVDPEQARAYAELRNSRRLLSQQTSATVSATMSATMLANNNSESVRSLDALGQGHSVQYLGLSGDVDPYLLEHMQFSSKGICDFGDFQYRRLASRTAGPRGQLGQTAEQMPVHFVISKPNQNENESVILPAKSEPIESLEELVSPEIGSRLVGLLVTHILCSPILRNYPPCTFVLFGSESLKIDHSQLAWRGPCICNFVSLISL